MLNEVQIKVLQDQLKYAEGVRVAAIGSRFHYKEPAQFGVTPEQHAANVSYFAQVNELPPCYLYLSPSMTDAEVMAAAGKAVRAAIKIVRVVLMDFLADRYENELREGLPAILFVEPTITTAQAEKVLAA